MHHENFHSNVFKNPRQLFFCLKVYHALPTYIILYFHAEIAFLLKLLCQELKNDVIALNYSVGNKQHHSIGMSLITFSTIQSSRISTVIYTVYVFKYRKF